MASDNSSPQISPCRRLSQLADTGDAEQLKVELERLSAKRDSQEIARDIVSCDFGKRNSLSSLHNAAMHGHAEVLKILLEARAEANATDDTGNTPLHFAAELGHAKCVHTLLQSGAGKNVRNNFGRSAAEKVVINNWDSGKVRAGKARIQELFDGGTWEEEPAPELPGASDPRRPQREAPLLAPYMDGAAEDLQDGDLLEELRPLPPAIGSRVQVPGTHYANSDISTAATLQDVEIDAGNPPTLAELVRCGNLPAVRSRLAEVQEQGGIRAVISEVSNIDGGSEDARSAPSPLHAAATAGHTEILQVLLATRADPSLADDAGNTLLHAAAGMGNEAVVRELLQAGANPRWKNNFGRSPRAHALPQSWDSEEAQQRKSRVCQVLQESAAQA